MVDVTYPTLNGIAKKLRDNGDGTYSDTVSDLQSAAVQGAVPLVVGAAAIAPGRAWAATVTTAGTATITFPDGSSHQVPLGVGYSRFPDAITGIATFTGTASFATLK